MRFHDAVVEEPLLDNEAACNASRCSTILFSQRQHLDYLEKIILMVVPVGSLWI